MGNQLTCPSATAVILTAILSGVCDSESPETNPSSSSSEHFDSSSEQDRILLRFQRQFQDDQPVEHNESDSSISEACVETWEGDELTDKECKLSLLVIRRDLDKKYQSFQQGKKQIFWVPAPESGYREDSTSFEVKAEDQLEAIPGGSFLLDWEVSGYAFGRKMLIDPYGERRQKELRDRWEYKTGRIQQGKENDEDRKRFQDKMRTIGVEEHWYVYVKLTDPLDKSQEPRYAKLHLVVGRAALEEESKRIAEEAGIDLRKLSHSTMIMVDVLSEKLFNEREKNRKGGLQITDLNVSLTLKDMFFRNPHDHQTCYQPSPEQHGTTELGLVMNCKTYLMRVLKKLGVEENPMDWSYDNKKQGLVFRKEELVDGLYVRLNDKKDDDVYKISHKNGKLHAISNKHGKSVC